MSVEKTKNNKILKGIIITLGAIAISAGVSPFIFDYFSNDDQIPQNMEMAETYELLEPTTIEKLDHDNNQQPSHVIANQKTAVTETETETTREPLQPAVPLPALQSSDQFVLEHLVANVDHTLLIPIDMISNMVVFIDNFSRGKVARNFSPLIAPQDAFSVTNKKGKLIIDDKSFHRYDQYAKLVNGIEVEKFIRFYTLLSPLIDEAYQDIGYPQGRFNSTFEKAIDQLLQTPLIHYPIEVIAPYTMYRYVDKNLEQLPDAQKLMLRMGADNLKIVQEKLREIKNELQRL